MNPLRIVIVCVYGTASVCLATIAAGEIFGGGHIMGIEAPIFVGGAVFCASVTVTECVLGMRKPATRPGFDLLPPSENVEE